METTVHPKRRNIQSYMVIKIVMINQIRNMIESFHLQPYGEEL